MTAPEGVASHAEAWIETIDCRSVTASRTSPPMRRRGLKPSNVLVTAIFGESPPMRRRGLKPGGPGLARIIREQIKQKPLAVRKWVFETTS